MTHASPTLILYPVFAMFLLVIVVLLYMGRMRIAAVRKGELSIKFFRAYADGNEPERLRVIARHYVNLFEMPVLFYVGVILVYITHQVSYWMIGCAWTYVAFRYMHSYVHLTSNNVMVRLSLYFASAFVLTVMWSTLLAALIRAG